MPLYEYECEAENGRRFEIIQKFSDAPLAVCPTCGQEVQKLLSAPAIQFKGTGWYVTDYAKKGGSGSSGSSGSSGEGGKSSESTKSESSSPQTSTSKDGSATGGSSSSK